MPFRVGLSPLSLTSLPSSLSFPLASFLFDPGISQLDLDRDQLARDRLCYSGMTKSMAVWRKLC